MAPLKPCDRRNDAGLRGVCPHCYHDLAAHHDGPDCPAIFELDGRRCVRAVGHEGLHTNGLLTWGPA